MQYKKFFVTVVSVAVLSVLALFLLGRWQQSQFQHFDYDEFAYLHWTSHYLTGSRPYRDFFFFGTPGYIFFLLPAFILGKGGLAPIAAARSLEFLAFVGLLVAQAALFWQMRKSFLALLVPVVILFLPMPSIKFLEIRPDTLMMLAVVIGQLFTVRYLAGFRPRDGFLAGASFGLSCLVFLKAALMVAVATLIVILASRGKRFIPRVGFFLSGMLAVGSIFGIWLLSLGRESWGTALYSLLKLPSEATQLGQLFPIPANFFFWPNGFFYGVGSVQALWANHAIWIFGLTVATVRLFTPFLGTKKTSVWQELLLGAMLAASLIFFAYISPFKHAQYLIPLAVATGWYAVDGLNFIWILASRRGIWLLLTSLIIIIGLLYMVKIFIWVNQTRMVYSLESELAPLKSVWAKIPTTEPMLDLEGGTLYYPDPYYVCCIPFGQFEKFLSRPLPSLPQALEVSNTKYIYQGQSRRTSTLVPSDLMFVRSQFVPVGDGTLWVRKDYVHSFD